MYLRCDIRKKPYKTNLFTYGNAKLAKKIAIYIYHNLLYFFSSLNRKSFNAHNINVMIKTQNYIILKKY